MITRSHVVNEPGSTLGELFPSYLPEPEHLVFEYVREATGTGVDGTGPQLRIKFPENEAVPLRLPATFSLPPELVFYDRKEGPKIPVVRGWPAYPGQVPAIGVALGSSPEDSGSEMEGGGFVGDLYAVQDDEVVGTASYYSQPLYAVVIVELIHENRDERDRLHSRMRPVLTRLKRILPDRYPLVKKVKVDEEMQEVSGGPPEAEQPFTVYVSLFSVHVWYESLEAVDVAGLAGILKGVEVTADPAVQITDSGVFTEAT